jgi:uncharacterized SAM-binding protein YcdF (DUF218 family)
MPLRPLAPLAFGTGLFLLLLVGASLVHGAPGIDGLWLSRRLPSLLTGLLATSVGAGLVAFAWGYLRAPMPRSLLAAGLSLFVAWAVADTVSVFRLIRAHHILPTTPLSVVSASTFVALLFAALLYFVVRSQGPGAALVQDESKAPLLLGLLIPLLAPLLQFATFGTTRYERRADVAFVMGAGVYPNNQVSQAAADRVDEAVRLYQRGLVKRVVMLAGDENEGSGMARYAVSRGVAANAVDYRADCVNTERAAALSSLELERTGEHALVVSHYYHLPRIKLLYAREGTSHQMWTVPATMDRRLVREPYYLVREIASTYHELIFRSKIGPHLKRWLER